MIEFIERDIIIEKIKEKFDFEMCELLYDFKIEEQVDLILKILKVYRIRYIEKDRCFLILDYAIYENKLLKGGIVNKKYNIEYDYLIYIEDGILKHIDKNFNNINKGE